MFTTHEWVQLLNATTDRTNAGDLKWKPAKAETAYQAQLNKETMALLRSVDGDGQPPYEFAIFRSSGESDASTKWKRFDATESQEMLDSEWGIDHLDILYRTIMRKANEVDEIFNSIMDALRPEE